MPRRPKLTRRYANHLSSGKKGEGIQIFTDREGNKSWLESYRTKSGKLLTRLGFFKKGRMLPEVKPLRIRRLK
jgi:hypothetical protein